MSVLKIAFIASAGLIIYAIAGLVTVYITEAIFEEKCDEDDKVWIAACWPVMALIGVVMLMGIIVAQCVTPIAKAIVRVPIAIIKVIEARWES